MRIATAIAAAVALSGCNDNSPASPSPPEVVPNLASSPVMAFDCDRPGEVAQGNVAEVNDAYSMHSVALVQAALQGDAQSLDAAIAPTARFSYIIGDVGVGPETAGGDASVEFFRKLRPSKFQLLGAGAGPFSMNPCSQVSSEVLLTKSGTDDAVALKFAYDRGVLMEVSGSATNIIDGNFVSVKPHG